MTKSKAYRLADTENLFNKDETSEDVIFRAMVIYAVAFAEYIEHNNFFATFCDGVPHWTKFDKRNKCIGLTTSELIAEFEKID